MPPASSLGLYEETSASAGFQLLTPDPDVVDDAPREYVGYHTSLFVFRALVFGCSIVMSSIAMYLQ